MANYNWVIKNGVLQWNGSISTPGNATIGGNLTVTGQGLFANGTASAPSISFTTQSTFGFYKPSDGLLDLVSGSTSRFRFQAGVGIVLSSGDSIAWSSGAASATADTFLYRDGANTLAQRNGVNAQAFRLYSTYTDASNYERLSIRAESGSFKIYAELSGSGTSRDLIFGTAGTARWTLNTNGHLVAATDNTYDIGADAATRPRTINAGTNVKFGGSLVVGSNGSLSAYADGKFRLLDAAGTSFGMLAFGGTTNSFPAWKRIGAELQARLADDSNVATVSMATAQIFTSYVLGSKLTISATAPTIASGFGTSPSIVVSNGTAAFTINVGTGGTANSGVITLPAATTGWVCHIENLTAQAANRAAVRTCQTASTTTSVTVQNQAIATGTATAWAASDVLSITCVAY